MPKAADLVESLLLPSLAALAVVDPAAARERRRRMTKTPGYFVRGSLVLHAAWLAAHPLPGAPWVWAIGDAHCGNLATLATITIAENVVDAVRLPDGRLLNLVAKGQAAMLGDVAVPVAPFASTLALDWPTEPIPPMSSNTLVEPLLRVSPEMVAAAAGMQRRHAARARAARSRFRDMGGKLLTRGDGAHRSACHERS